MDGEDMEFVIPFFASFRHWEVSCESSRRTRWTTPSLVRRRRLRSTSKFVRTTCSAIRRSRYHVTVTQRTEVQHEVIDRLRSAGPPAEASASDLVVVGVLHAIDLEPDQVAIRTPAGLDWSCEYPSELESDILPLIGRRKWLEPYETEHVADCEGVRIGARPRPTSHDYIVLWPRADRYEPVVDLERGILLRLSSLVRGREAMSDELLAVRFDEPLTEELLHFSQAE